MNKAYLIFTLVFAALLLYSCGNPTIEELAGPPGGIDRTLPIEPPDDDDDDDGGTPGAKRIVVEVTGYGITKKELKGLKLPYKKKTVKVAPMGKTSKSKNCPKKHKQHCVENRQVLVAFDLAEVTKHLSGYYISDIQLAGQFYSVGKNHRTELLCLLHKKVCSGRGIIKFPGWGMPWIAKMLWWEKKFWNDDYNGVVKTQNFHDLIEASWNEDEGLYMMENRVL